MRWLKSPLSSFYGLLGHSSVASDSTLDVRIDDIRSAMLDCLGAGATQQFPQLIRRIRYASDIQALWYLRGELMGALAEMHGEAAARERVQVLTELFQGMLPGGLSSRPSPLVG